MYLINKGVNRPLEFRGLKAQYVWWLAAVVVGDMVLVGLTRLVGLNTYACLLLALGLGGAGIFWVYRLSRRYGRFGRMKARARKGVPLALVCRSRKVFLELFRDGVGE